MGKAVKRMKKLRRIWRRYMLRPFLYTAFTRLVLGLFAALLCDYFFSGAAGRPLRSTLFLLASVFFALLAWIAWLRLDGVSLPRLMNLRIGPKKQRDRITGDMIDFVDDEPPIPFEDLEDDEKDCCLLCADLICCVVFFLASFL